MKRRVILSTIAAALVGAVAALSLPQGGFAANEPMVGGAPEAALKTSASSVMEESACQLVAPSTLTCVSALARPSRTHCRKVSAETGPYSLPLPPRILYMVFVQLIFASVGGLVFVPKKSS